jgi:hypothetical protein
MSPTTCPARAAGEMVSPAQIAMTLNPREMLTFVARMV